ncbi:unnamed protein product [Ilex paraguariensis]|uniref:Uncharacterized protein n=1 Tax=Ilex paraguariensis TaxID=185542 RepID=A0ABC8R8C7_9AQUA
MVMDIDVDIAGWVLEFLLRQSLEDQTLDSVIRVLPLPKNNPSLKRSMLLRRIESEIAYGLVSEKVLELLEQIEELGNEEGVEVSEAMKVAFCAVAVDCTVSFLKGNEDDNEGRYFHAVRRIWRGRVCKMERSEKVGLVSEELKNWKDEIEAALWDKSVRQNLVKRSKGKDAVEAVRVYVKEEKERMGPSFLEFVAETMRDDNTVRKVLELGRSGMCEDLREGEELLPDAGQDGVVSNNNKETHKANVLPRQKHVANKRHRGTTSGTLRGAKIADTEDGGVRTSCKKYDIPLSPAINKVQEALASSSLELQAVVKDPLPDALHLAETIIASMAREDREHEPAMKNHNKVDAKEPNSCVDNSAAAGRANDANLDNQCCSHQNNAPKLSLMARNNTAHTYEDIKLSIC